MSEFLEKMTVSQLTLLLKTTLEEAFFGLTVEGEVSGFKTGPNGHWYFSLKDDEALISAVVWRSTAQRLNFHPKDGQKVVVKGSISVYAQGGKYQINCSSIRLSGEGDILAKLEERKRKYQALGYFDQNRKKPIPKRPSKVAVITSPTGAALQDILQVSGRRNSNIDIIILPAIVQGDESAKSVASRIRQVNTFNLADVMIVGRGGGSLEDLLSFSSDEVIQAIYESEIPVISAVGHEIDWALSDFVADLRAPTPSAAAELVCESQSDQKEKLNGLVVELKRSIESILSRKKLAYQSLDLATCGSRLVNRIYTKQMSIAGAVEKCTAAISDSLYEKRNRLDVCCGMLETLDPVMVLKRGFSIVTDSNGKTVKNTSDLKNGTTVAIRFAKGKAKASITEVNDGR